MLTLYVKFMASLPFETSRRADDIFDVLDRLLSNRIELKTIVLSRVKPTKFKAPLMRVLFERLHGQLIIDASRRLGHVGQSDTVALVLLNAAALMLGSWYTLLNTDEERDSFKCSVFPLVQTLQALRIEVRQLTGDAAKHADAFYEHMDVESSPVAQKYQFCDLK